MAGPEDYLEELVDELLEADGGELVPSAALGTRVHGWLSRHGRDDPGEALIALASLAHAATGRNGDQVHELLGNACRAWLRACDQPVEWWHLALEATGDTPTPAEPEAPLPSRRALTSLGLPGPAAPDGGARETVRGDAFARFNLADLHL